MSGKSSALQRLFTEVWTRLWAPTALERGIEDRAKQIHAHVLDHV